MVQVKISVCTGRMGVVDFPAFHMEGVCMKRLLFFFAGAALAAQFSSADQKVWLDQLNLGQMTSGWKKPAANKSVDGAGLRIYQTNFARGVGTHAPSAMRLELKDALSFDAKVGVDAETINDGDGTVRFRVFAEKKLVADTGVLTKRKGPVALHADLRGAKWGRLEVTDAGDGMNYDHADWCEAYFTVADGGHVKPMDGGRMPQLGILTPPTPATPRINGPKVFGVRPGNPVLFTIPATGVRPIVFSAKGLPDGVSLDAKTGFLSGKVEKAGNYPILFTAKNAKGETSREFTLCVGETIALTPPMGWNSWNCFAHAVSDEKIRSAAKAMVDSGLADHGWSYINIDDYWQNKPGSKDDTLIGPDRLPDGRIASNKRFPDMKGLADYVHSLGLKIGLYSSPGPLTCGRCIGSWKHERQDAETYAEWGYDYLKYDWCSYGRVAPNNPGSELKRLMIPYTVMGRCLRDQKRDIVFSLCQYGMGHVSTWGPKVYGSCWRTTGDITDTWSSMRSIADRQDGLEPFVRPGAWNDPDMLIVGKVGWGNLHPTRLTPNEQYTHISLWCLFCSPLLIGCDMTQLDAFTLNLLTNDEVLEVNQDPLGRAASRVHMDETYEVWTKAMSDGSTVAGFVSRDIFPAEITVSLADIGLPGGYRVRDLWRQKDLGAMRGVYRTELPGHACTLLRFYPSK